MHNNKSEQTTIFSKIKVFFEITLILLAIGMVSIVLFQIIARLGGFSVRWSEEFARFLSIWTTFLSVPLLLLSGRLITIDFFLSKITPRIKPLVKIIHLFLIFCACLVLIWVGFAQIEATWNQTSPGLLWPMGLFTLPIVISGILCIFVLPSSLKKDLLKNDNSLKSDEGRFL